MVKRLYKIFYKKSKFFKKLAKNAVKKIRRKDWWKKFVKKNRRKRNEFVQKFVNSFIKKIHEMFCQKNCQTSRNLHKVAQKVTNSLDAGQWHESRFWEAPLLRQVDSELKKENENQRQDDRSLCKNQFEIYIPIKLVIRKTEVSNTDLCVWLSG